MKLTTQQIMTVLKPVWPKKKEITKSNVLYTKVKVKRLLPIYRSTQNYEEFTKCCEESVLLEGIDNVVDINDDEAYELAQEICEEVIGEVGSEAGKVLSVLQYLKLISVRAKGFVYSWENSHRMHRVTGMTSWGVPFVCEICRTSTHQLSAANTSGGTLERMLAKNSSAHRRYCF